MTELQQSGGACSASECAQKEGGAALPHCPPFVFPQVSGYSLLVQAADSGIPVLSSTATVNIDISDVNDNSPVFTPANYTAVIQVSTSALPGTCLYALSIFSLLGFTRRGLPLFLPNQLIQF